MVILIYLHDNGENSHLKRANMKYSQVIGILAAIVLVLSSFMHWAWYPDLEEYFTGFYSYNSNYGRPGRYLMMFATVAVIMFLIPRIWAKRINMFLNVLILAYAIKTFILFSGCYKGICPVRQIGMWIMLFSSAVMLLSALFPTLKVKSASI